MTGSSPSSARCVDCGAFDGVRNRWRLKWINQRSAAFAFYCDKLRSEVTFQAKPDDLFFGIVKSGGAMIFLKDVCVEPLPNYTRDVTKASHAGTLMCMSPTRTRFPRSLRRAM